MDSLDSAIKERYASIAEKFTHPSRDCSPCCSKPLDYESHLDPITRDLYSDSESAGLPKTAMQASLGCGNPTALVEILPGETVLDLGSGNF
jgi:arsenite methyltransferase